MFWSGGPEESDLEESKGDRRTIRNGEDYWRLAVKPGRRPGGGQGPSRASVLSNLAESTRLGTGGRRREERGEDSFQWLHVSAH
jgi:hypothetical protein